MLSSSRGQGNFRGLEASRPSLTSGFYLLRLPESETISKFTTVYFGRHFQRKLGEATYAATPLDVGHVFQNFAAI